MIRIHRFTFKDKKFTQQAFAIRKEVFVKEQQVDATLEYENEEISNHYLAYFDDVPAATARWRFTTDGIKLERFATLKAYRKKGLAAALLAAILEDTVPLDKSIYLNSQITAVGFYEKYGFKTLGDEFVEADIKHYRMEWEAPDKAS